MDRRAAIELIKTRKAVRKKLQSLKSDISKSEINLGKVYSPIIQPLTKLVSSIIKQEPYRPKLEFEAATPNQSFTKPTISPVSRKNLQLLHKSPNRTRQSILPAVETVYQTSDDDDDADANATLQDYEMSDISVEEARNEISNILNSETFSIYLDQYDSPLPRTYVEDMIRDTNDEFDFQMGINLDLATDKFSIGDSVVDFDGPNFIIKGVKYLGTPGLYELLFKKDPLGYTEKDKAEYVDILRRTNTLRRNYNPKEQLQGTRAKKYISIIKPFLSKRTGKGMVLEVNNKPIEYKHFDDYNEIVERLKILVASQAAGHTGHNNEIVSILEELREAKIIR